LRRLWKSEWELMLSFSWFPYLLVTLGVSISRDLTIELCLQAEYVANVSALRQDWNVNGSRSCPPAATSFPVLLRATVSPFIVTGRCAPLGVGFRFESSPPPN